MNNMEEFSIPLSTDIAGNTLSMKGYTFGTGGPKVYIQGGIHGGEVTFWIFNELFNYLSNKKVNGTITLVPISNPYAWNQRVYFYTVGKFNLQTAEDWNRGYPGDNTSLAKRRAKKVMDLVKDYDYSICLHTSRSSIPFSIFTEETRDDALIKALGMKYNYLLSNKADDSMMSVLSKSQSTFGFEIECGSHDSYNPVFIQQVTSAILRFLAYKGFINAEIAQEVEEKILYKAYEKYFSEYSGFLELVKRPAENYLKGEELFKTFPSTNYFSPQVIKGKQDGIIIKSLPSTIVWEGDEVLQTIDMNSVEVIK